MVKRSKFERLVRNVPCYRKKLLHRANYRRHIRKLERRSKKLAIALRTAPEDQIHGMVMEIAAISMALAFAEEH